MGQRIQGIFSIEKIYIAYKKWLVKKMSGWSISKSTCHSGWWAKKLISISAMNASNSFNEKQQADAKYAVHRLHRC